MKKCFYTMAVIALFAIGFAASDDSGEVYIENGGEKFYRVDLQCQMCGATPEYAHYYDNRHGATIDKPRENMWEDRFYCNTCISKVRKEYGF